MRTYGKIECIICNNYFIKKTYNQKCCWRGCKGIHYKNYQRVYGREWNILNKERRRESNRINKRKYRKLYRERILQQLRKCQAKNKDKYRKRLLEKIKTDNVFRMKWYFRNTIRDFFKERKCNKNHPIKYIIGCSWKEFKHHLENQFEEGMNWENYGGKRKDEDGNIRDCWEIHHVIPMKIAKNEEDIIKLNHHTNLKPLWWWDNIKA